ncbi:MAG: FtsW/RodA/SpoVE family cell cycle protein [Oscillospiraceae bacterium]|nr:FtsW/RodA/SpoVE family cell cycle protein [Oscillospiraceae bacterium]MBR4101168.1 FtsW/RodA/SpoVE family cell cycle protein [Oscillospiraceae bacterium]
MLKNGISYIGTVFLLLLTHVSMLGVVIVRGNIESPTNLLLLAGAVLGLDLAYIAVIKWYRQMTYTLDLLLLCVLNMGLIFQSCFGEVQLSVKHLITCLAALAACQAGFLLTRNQEWIRTKKPYIYAIIGILILSILLLTGDRSMWINIGSFSLQPSEFIKPCFVLICAASIMELHKKKKILFFYVSKDTLCLCAMALVIFGLQWWCRDLGSLPTFAAVFGCALVCRFCYPRARISKTAVGALCVGAAIVLAAAWMLAPSYVQDRLHVDIWADPYGNGYQQCQALIGIARGGWLGLGPGQGYLHNVFAYESDIVFASICEEWGLLYAFLMVIAILMMLMTVLMNPPKSYYHATMATGVVAVFVVQMALNIFGSCNLIPFTGVTLPFISQGGSSMVTCGFLVGMLKAGQSPLFRHKADKPKKKKKHSKKKKAAGRVKA